MHQENAPCGITVTFGISPIDLSLRQSLNAFSPISDTFDKSLIFVKLHNKKAAAPILVTLPGIVTLVMVS